MCRIKNIILSFIVGFCILFLVPNKSFAPEDDSIKILLVDDETMIVDMLQELLEEFVFVGRKVEFRTANNPTDALAILEKERFDLIITDWKMQGIEEAGLQVVKYFEGKENIPAVIAMSGTLLQKRVEEIRKETGLNLLFIKKPWALDALKKIIDVTLLEKKIQSNRGVVDCGDTFRPKS